MPLLLVSDELALLIFPPGLPGLEVCRTPGLCHVQEGAQCFVGAARTLDGSILAPSCRNSAESSCA